MLPPVMSTMGVGRGIVFPNDSVWRLQPPATNPTGAAKLWGGNSGSSALPAMMRTGVYGAGADGTVWEYAPPNFTKISTVFVSTAWNPADLNSCALSNNGTTATITSVLGTPGVRGVNGLGTGKYYWEATMTTWNGGADIGLATATASLSGGQPGQAAATFNNGTPGGIVINSGVAGNLGARANGDIIGVATDLTARLVWFRVCPSGNWNGSGTANPATGTGGFDISTLTGNLYPHFAGGLNQQTTANFGTSAFSGTTPTGFTAGWGTLQ